MRQFLLSSFPSLQFQEPAPLKLEEMLTRCAQQLSEAELEELSSVCSAAPGGSTAFARDWQTAWAGLKDLNNRERMKRLTPDAAGELPAAPVQSDERLNAEGRRAWDAGDPLQREQALLLAQWRWIEERRRAAPYTEDDLLGYALQLKLLEQRDAWNADTGAVQFAEQTESFMNPLLETLRAKEDQTA